MQNGNKKRRLSVAPMPNNKKTEMNGNKENLPQLLDMEENDDEAEKLEIKDRRKSLVDSLKALQNNIDKLSNENSSKNKSTFFKKNISPNSSQKPINKTQLSNDQLVELYATCIQLSTEGKINQKNTWDLNLIDYMDDVIQFQKNVDGNSELVNFQAASCTLDASVKIYANRVDSIHKETYKVLGGLSRTERTDDTNPEIETDKLNTERPQDETEGGEAIPTDTTEKEDAISKKRPKRPAHGGNTLDSFENIDVNKFDLSFDVDPLFSKTSSAFDEGGPRGLLLNHLSVYNNCELIFDSNDAIQSNNSSSNSNVQCDITDLEKNILNLAPDISKLEICPTFSRFVFARDEQIEEEDKLQDQLDVQFSDEDVPEGDVIVPYDDEYASIQQREENLLEEILSQDPDDMEDPNKPDPVIAQMESSDDFTFFDPKSLGNWAGPNHWKFRVPQKENNPDKEKKKTKKEPFFFNFDDPPKIDFSKAFAPPGKASITLSNNVLKKNSQSNNLLPEDVHYELRMLTQLFNKPRCRVSLNKRKRSSEQEHFSDYEPVQPLGFGANQEHQLDDDDIGIIAPSDFDNHFEQQQVFIQPPTLDGVDLIEKPVHVEQIKLNFAKKAKLVDVKALKDTIGMEVSSTKDSIKFSEVLQSLPNRVDKAALTDISVPYSFICLLHLANEEGLKIIEDPNSPALTDLIITNPN